MQFRLSLLAIAGFVASAIAADLPAIEIVGNKFYFSNNGSQFLMRGIAYQQDTANTSSSYVDPLADPVACKRDIPIMQQLNTNVIRVYALNASEDHTVCMQMLQDAGIYVVADLSEPKTSINRESPAWNLELLNRYTDVVDKFSNYTNILGFFAGNEVSNDKTNTNASAYVKAAVRDTKAYIKAKGYRLIPVGYSANDDKDIRVSLADYFACGDASEHADFFGINMYEWCGKSTYKTSGYSVASDDYKDLGIPIFFSEYGCNEVQPRLFQEVGTLYSTEMTDLWSGGIVYMYFQEANNYGLVSVVNPTSVSTMADFSNYKSEINNISPSYAQSSAATSMLVTACPTATDNWEAATVLPPTPNKEVCDCMDAANTCVVDDSVSSSDYGDLFGIVCGNIDCSGISGNGTSGVYGAYSPCAAKQQLNFALNLYYNANGKSSSACAFSGSASLRTATTASSCSAYLSSAGSSGMGSLANLVNTAGGSASGSGSGSKSGSAASSSGSSSSKKSDAPASYGSSWMYQAIVAVAATMGLALF